MSTENMTLYEQFRSCPKEAQKPITAGRLKGMTDVNPMWRIKKLTETFGPCGFGWKTNIVRMWTEEAPGGEIAAHVEIQLFVKWKGEWSEPIVGIGGSMWVAKESSGLRAEDECYKKAYTDAISVACKALGIAADVYFARDPHSKYPTDGDDGSKSPKNEPQSAKKAEADKQASQDKKPLSYPQILDEKLGAGIYADKTWKEVYKTDREYIMNFPLQEGVTHEMEEIVSFINAQIRAANSASNGGDRQ